MQEHLQCLGKRKPRVWGQMIHLFMLRDFPYERFIRELHVHTEPDQ